MNEEAELIVKAIESLRPENIWYKDYLFPVVSSFLSAILGAFVAYFTLQYQDKIKSEREKLNICNDWTLAIEGLFQSLIAFKGNYYEKMSRDPFQRALSIVALLAIVLQLIKMSLSYLFLSLQKMTHQAKKLNGEVFPVLMR